MTVKKGWLMVSQNVSLINFEELDKFRFVEAGGITNG